MAEPSDRGPDSRGKRKARATAASRSPAPGDAPVRDAQPGGGSQDGRLAPLDSPHLAAIVPHLPAETLHRLIRREGLDACGELLASATPAQLASVLDLDLWRSPQPGADERFDPARFGEWIAALIEGGDAVAARIVARLDQHLVIAGLSRHIRVFDPAARASAGDRDAMEVESARPEGLSIDVGGYLLEARTTEGWDAIVALLLALEADHRDCFHAVMRGCRRLSHSGREIDGLDDLLAEPEQVLHDLALEREDRRVDQGYLSAADARSFLQMARHSDRSRGASSSLGPIAAAYLRSRDQAAAPGPGTRPQERRVEPATASTDGSTRLVADFLSEAGLLPEQPRALLEAGVDRSRVSRLQTLMAFVRDADVPAYLERTRELAFLANALMAGCSVQSRGFTAQEASEAAVATCNLGLEHWPMRWADAETSEPASAPADARMPPDSFLVDHTLVMAFEVGWAMLHEAGMSVAGHLVEVLRDLRCVDAETQAGLSGLRRELARRHEAGTPWLARDALDVIATLDTPAWVALLGVMDECPVLPAALTAILERRTGAVSATAFEFISTRAQLGQVQAFAGRLLDILVG